MLGRVRKLQKEKGFGFIEVESGSFVFFHFSGVVGKFAGFDQLKDGDIVEFDLEKGQKIPSAINISLIGATHTASENSDQEPSPPLPSEADVKEAATPLKNEALQEMRRFVSDQIPKQTHLSAKAIEKFRASFFEADFEAFVLSVDLRRSTELMLKANESDGFALFLTEICNALENSVRANYAELCSSRTNIIN